MGKYLKFSLRTFLILVLFVCVALAFFPRDTIELYRRQAEAVVSLASTKFELERRAPDSKFYSHFLKLFIPSGDLHQVVAANARSKWISDDDLKSLKD